MTLYLALLVFGGGLFWGAIKQHRRVRQIEDTPSSKTSSAPQGLVELQGFAWPEGDVYMMDGQREVVYYSREIQYARPAVLFYGRGSRWITLAKKEHNIPFYLIDDTGLVRIDPKGSETFLQVTTKKSWKDLSAEKKRELEKEFKAPVPFLSYFMGMMRGPIKTAMLSPLFFIAVIFYLYDKILFSLIPHYPPSSGDKQYRVVESWIDVGSPIYVSGSFQTQKVETTSATQKGLTFFCKNIAESSFQVLSESAKVMGFEDFKKDYMQLAAQARKAASTAAEAPLSVYGQIKMTEAHALFLGDGFEAQLKEKMKAWLYLRFLAGAALMAVAVSVGSLKASQSFKPRSTASASAVKVQNLGKLHQMCVDGHKQSCNDLVSNQANYHLPPANLQYYKSRLEKVQTK